MDVALVILFIAFLITIVGYASGNYFFTLAGGFLILLMGILFLTNPLSVTDGYTINETDANITTIDTVKTSPPGLMNHAFNLVLILIGMMFMWDSYTKLQEEKWNAIER